MSSVPYYERSLGSFSDEVITDVIEGRNGTWYAVLDVGPKRGPGDPDFSTGARTREDAVALCAAKIRRDAVGVGKYAPHSVLTGYDLHFRLARHWASKEAATVS